MNDTNSGVVRGLIVPGKPHPLLAPNHSPAWQAVRNGFEQARKDLESSDADLLLLYSTQWLSVIGHQIQADPEPEWVHVDQEWHELGSLPYKFRIDCDYAHAYEECAHQRGLHARTVAYRGFPVDTGTIVALQLLNPDNRLPACVVSCNMYADRSETLILGKAAADALRGTGKKAVAVAVTSFSNRYHDHPIDPQEDRISSLKDDEWNRKLLDILEQGRLEDVSQLAREFSLQANGDQKMKAIWWLASLMGQDNRYDGRIYEYQPIWGTGAAVVGLTPARQATGTLEYDEEDADVYRGDRNVLAAADGEPVAPGVSAANEVVEASKVAVAASTSASPGIRTQKAPDPVGAYPHARRVGDLLFLSGVGPRQAGTDAIPGGPVRDKSGNPTDYDVAAQTRAVIENVRTILEASGSSLDQVLDITVFLIDMDRDFQAFNAVYKEFFQDVGATRTTIAIDALPTPIAVEFKVLAAAQA